MADSSAPHLEASPHPGEAPLRWGILGAANIARRRVIPALQQSARARLVAVASRDPRTASQFADEMQIGRAYGSYDALLADPDIDAVYIPLPNHLHVPWTIRAAEAGKHVLCEKPIALNAEEAQTLLELRDRTGVQICEAFMVRSHPRWHTVKAMLGDGRIGPLQTMSAHFSYARKGAENIRSRPDWGGGALMDIGCYPVLIARWMYDAEPTAVMASIDRDPDFGVDRLVSAILRFPEGTAQFTVGGQLVLHQQLHLFGTRGFIAVDVPFNPPEDSPTRIVIDDGRDLAGSGAETILVPSANQFVLQVEAFADAVAGRAALPFRLEDSVANMAVLDALVRSGVSGRWEAPAPSRST